MKKAAIECNSSAVCILSPTSFILKPKGVDLHLKSILPKFYARKNSLLRFNIELNTTAMKPAAILLLSLSLLFSKDEDLTTAKSVESRMVKVNTNLYANKYETTNAEYKQFLTHLKENGKADLLEAAQIHNDGWRRFYAKANWPYADHEGFDNYPVVNITYEGALAYCEWLTERYHANKKRKFSKVKFRLPTREEWTVMAKNGRRTQFPWGGPYLKNRNGEFLANFKRFGNQLLKVDINDPTNVTIIGFEDEKERNNYPVSGTLAITVPVEHFEHHRKGLCNVVGNAAEMVAEKGSTKGGSWGSSGYYLQIDAEDEFEGLEYSPYVGFRYFMEVIEP